MSVNRKTKVCTECGSRKRLSSFGKRFKSKPTLKARCKSCDREYQKKWLSDPNNYKKAQNSWLRAARDPARKRVRQDLQLRRLYGISLDEWESLFRRQGGRCKLCHKRRRLLTDHDHVTGRFRGLICYPCNSAIGLLGDTKIVVRRLLKYLSG